MMPSEAIWCVFSCIYRNGTFGAIANWGTRTPRDTGVFTIDHLQDKLRTLQVAMVPSKKTGSPWHPHGLMRFFPFIVEKMERLWDIFFWKVNKSENPPFFSKKNPWIFATSPHPWGCHCEALEERLQGSSLSMLKGRRIETQQGKALQTTVYIILVIYYVSVHVLLNVMCVLHVCMYIYTYWLSYLYIFNCDLYDMIVVWYSKEHVYQWQWCLLWSWCNRRLRLRNRSMCSRR